jgi:hypothetical protein
MCFVVCATDLFAQDWDTYVIHTHVSTHAHTKHTEACEYLDSRQLQIFTFQVLVCEVQQVFPAHSVGHKTVDFFLQRRGNATLVQLKGETFQAAARAPLMKERDAK